MQRCWIVLRCATNTPCITCCSISCIWAALVCGWTRIKIPLLSWLSCQVSLLQGSEILGSQNPDLVFHWWPVQLPSWLFMVLLRLLMCWMSDGHFFLYHDTVLSMSLMHPAEYCVFWCLDCMLAVFQLIDKWIQTKTLIMNLLYLTAQSYVSHSPIFFSVFSLQHCFLKVVGFQSWIT